uniref:BED-type domain-containing protein n=1 Tax=Ditylenchus dipsaci TaxID=166011 RepID=A0A915D368_9BILA
MFGTSDFSALENSDDFSQSQIHLLQPQFSTRCSKTKICDTDPLSRRYECIVCGHVTKPNVSPNTLSQHFGDKHPEMRAQANNALIAGNVAFKPRSKRIKIKESPGLKNQTISDPCPNAVSAPLADDIVFGSFLNDNSLEEFDRLARSSTVFPYFEIVIKTDADMSLKLLNSLSTLFAKLLITRKATTNHSFCR